MAPSINQTVSVDPLQVANVDPTTISIDTGIGTEPVSPETASSRAAKLTAAKVLPDKTYEDIHSAILNAEERLLREEAASTDSLKSISERNRKLTDALKSRGGTLTLSDFNKLQEQIDNPKDFYSQPASPDYVFEKGYSKYAFDGLSKTILDNDSDLKDAVLQVPEAAKTIINAGTEFTAKNAVLDNLIENANDTISNQGTFSWLTDQAKSMLPIIGQAYSETKLRGNTPGVSVFKGLLGTNLDEQGKKAYEMPIAEFTKFVTDTYNNLKKDNPSVALAWLSGIRGQSTSEQVLNNLFTLSLSADIASGFGIAKALGKSAVKAVSNVAAEAEIKQATKDVIQAAGIKGDIVVETVAATGDVGEAAVQKASTGILKNFKGTSEPIKQALEALPSGLQKDVVDIKANPSKLGQTLTNMLTDAYEASMGRLMEVATTVSRVQRVPLEQITLQQMKELKDNIAKDYPSVSNAILDISDPVYNKIANTYYMDLAIGKPGAELWFRKADAVRFAEINGISGYKLEQQGAGWYLRITKNLNEEDHVLQDLLVSAGEGKSKSGFFNSTLRMGWFRTPEDTVSENARINRKVATYSQSRLNMMANEERKYIQDIKNGSVRFDPVTGNEIPWYKRIPANVYNFAEGKVTGRAKQNWQRLERVLASNQTMRDEAGNLGMYFKGPGDFEDFYLRQFNEMPTPEETMAYFATKRLTEIDRALRNIGMYKNKARLGTLSHKIMLLDDSGKPVYSPSFDGIQQHNFPGGEDTVAIMGNKPGEEKLYSLGEGSNLSIKTVNKLREDIAAGKLKIVRIYDPEQRPLSGFGKIKDERIRYVITKATDTQPLSWEQVPRRGGGHFEYEYDHYIKQAKVRPSRVGNKFTHWYEGDTTVMPVELRNMGKDVADKLNTVRQLLKDKNVVGAEAYAKQNLPIEWKELKTWFGKKGRLSLDEPFYVVPKNRSIIDLDKSLEDRYTYRDTHTGLVKSTFKDGTRSGSDARQFQVEYTGQRDSYDMFSFNDVGTKNNPLYTRTEAKLIDPIPTMNRALSKIINSTFMDDIKVSHMEAWIRENKDILAATDSELRHAPFWHFNNPVYKIGADDAQVALAKSNHFKLKQFVGVPSYTDTFLHSMAQRLAETAYAKLGPKGAALVPHWLVTKVKDPITFVRSMTYHFKLGLFAWPQLMVQNQTFANIWALNPRSAAAGTYGAFLHQWSRLNPAMLDTLDRYATKVRVPGFHAWKPGEFKEAYQELMKTGFANVGGEYVNLDAMSKYQVASNAGSQFLDWGQVFFKEGEQNVRYGAWYTAFKEYRKNKPIGRITEAERAKILDQADLLYTNMSRASASALHTGVFSLTSQFMSYQMRLAELFLSKRIGSTLAERNLTRARLLMANGLLYGIPVGVGVTGLPLSEYLRTKAFENGYVVGDNWITTLVNEGIPALAAAWITGEGSDFDSRVATGNKYNFGQRYGSSGFDQIRQAVTGSKEWWEVVLGPSGNIAGNTALGSYRLGQGIAQWLVANLSGQPNPYPLKIDDLLEVGNQITSVSGIKRYIYALNTGKWLSNQETQLTRPGEISPASATFMTAMGLSPTSTQDVWIKEAMLKDQNEAQKAALKEFIKEWHRSLDAADNNDYEQAKQYRTRALAWLVSVGYPAEKVPEAMEKASTGRFSSLVDQIDWDLYFKYAPEDKKELYRDTYRTIIKHNRGQ